MLTKYVVTLAMLFSVQASVLGDISDSYAEWWTNRRVKMLSKQFDKRPYEQIGWADGIQHSLKLAEEHQRPIFLFTFDGLSMLTGRC